jgi:hypothetical protein
VISLGAQPPPPMEEVLLASMVAELDLAVPARIRRLPVAR